MAKSIIALKYNPNLSVAENAKRCGVSESAIRKYIRTHGISRNYDNAISKQRAIIALKEQNPTMSLAEMSRKLGLSINTIKKYLNQSPNQSELDTSKVSTFDIKRNVNNIKSFSYSQDEILCNILHLYIHAETFECDFTFSIGVFYRNIPRPPMRFDKYPQCEGVLPLEEAYGLPDNSLSLHNSYYSVTRVLNGCAAAKAQR